MKTILAFIVGFGFALLSQSVTAWAAPEDELLSIAALRSEVQLLKTQLETVKVEMTSRLNGVDLETKMVRDRLSQLENGEPRNIPLEVR